MSPIATYSNIDYENKILNNESTDVVKNKSLPKVVGGTGGSGPIPRNGKTKKIFNLLILEHLKSHFIKTGLLNKFLIPLFFICVELIG